MPDDLTTRAKRLLWAKLPHPQTCPDEIDAAARAVVALVLDEAAGRLRIIGDVDGYLMIKGMGDKT